MDRFKGQSGIFVQCPATKFISEDDNPCCVFVYADSCRCCGWTRYERFNLVDGKVTSATVCMEKGLPVSERCGFDCKSEHHYPDCPLGKYESGQILLAARLAIEAKEHVPAEEKRKEA